MPHAVWGHNDLMLLSLIGDIGGQLTVQRHAYEATGTEQALLVSDALAQAWAATLAADWRASMQTLFRACLPSNYNLRAVRAQVVEVLGMFEHRLVASDDSAGLPVAGTIGAAALALTNCANIKWRSRGASRSGRGRTYLPLAFDQANDGALTGGAVTTVKAYADAMITRYGADAVAPPGANLTIYSRPYNNSYYVKRIGGVPEVIHLTDYAGNSSNVVSSQVDPVVRTQRRREFGVGA